MKHALVLAFVAVAAGACAVERRTVVVADDPCASYGYTAPSADYARCQQRVADQRHYGRAAAGYSEAQIVADSQIACLSYGLPLGTAPYDRCVKNEVAARRPV